MAKDETDFQKLLAEAPMAPSADTVTVVGVLSRTPDAARFVLTLPNGRTESLDVVAVKSAKAIAGAIGQALVQLELDAKRVPEGIRDPAIRAAAFKQLDWPYGFGPLGPFGAVNGPYGPNWPWGGTNKQLGDSPGNYPTIIENLTGLANDPPASYAPFVAAAPHQAHHPDIAALAQGGPTAYFTYPLQDIKSPVQDMLTTPGVPYPWSVDHPLRKPHADQLYW